MSGIVDGSINIDGSMDSGTVPVPRWPTHICLNGRVDELGRRGYFNVSRSSVNLHSVRYCVPTKIPPVRFLKGPPILLLRFSVAIAPW